jgi:hypothetical protein
MVSNDAHGVVRLQVSVRRNEVSVFSLDFFSELIPKNGCK